MKPPFSFEGMTARVFPLRANLDSLQRFCNSYLNFIPPEAGRFRAVVPYVYYIMLDYGRMAINIANIGWFSQREFLFCIPIQWYRVVDGQWQFHDWATVTPFIYVNNDMSMQIGDQCQITIYLNIHVDADRQDGVRLDESDCVADPDHQRVDDKPAGARQSGDRQYHGLPGAVRGKAVRVANVHRGKPRRSDVEPRLSAKRREPNSALDGRIQGRERHDRVRARRGVDARRTWHLAAEPG